MVIPSRRPVCTVQTDETSLRYSSVRSANGKPAFGYPGVFGVASSVYNGPCLDRLDQMHVETCLSSRFQVGLLTVNGQRDEKQSVRAQLSQSSRQLMSGMVGRPISSSATSGTKVRATSRAAKPSYATASPGRAIGGKLRLEPSPLQEAPRGLPELLRTRGTKPI
jgi:hypothetical protein